VIAEDEIEARVGQGQLLGRGVKQRHLDRCGSDVAARVRELTIRIVQGDDLRAALSEKDGPLCGATAELEDVLALHIAEDAELGLS
jgi:hypothetical protein